MCLTFVCCAHSGNAEINTLPVRTLYALYTHFNKHFEISKCHFGIQKWHFDVFKRSLVISCRIRAWLGLVHTFQATNGFLLRTLGTKSTDLACTHFVRTLYALYTHFHLLLQHLQIAYEYKLMLCQLEALESSILVHLLLLETALHTGSRGGIARVLKYRKHIGCSWRDVDKAFLHMPCNVCWLNEGSTVNVVWNCVLCGVDGVSVAESMVFSCQMGWQMENP